MRNYKKQLQQVNTQERTSTNVVHDMIQEMLKTSKREEYLQSKTIFLAKNDISKEQANITRIGRRKTKENLAKLLTRGIPVNTPMSKPYSIYYHMKVNNLK